MLSLILWNHWVYTLLVACYRRLSGEEIEIHKFWAKSFPTSTRNTIGKPQENHRKTMGKPRENHGK